MPLNDDETPSQAMKRIEAEVRGTSSAQRNLGGGYSGNVGAQAGPLSGMVMTSSEPTAGQPTMRGVRGALGPISFTHVQPSGRVAPTRTIGVGGAPFDADAYFGVSAAQTPSGRQYGVDVGAPLPAPRTPGGRPYEGAEGSFNAYGQYNPSRRDLNAGFEFRRNFAEGGPFEARPLTIYRKEPPPSAPVGEVESRGPVERPVERPVDYAAAMQTFQDAQKLLEPTRNKAPEPIVVEEPKPIDPYAGLPAGEKYNRQFADTLINAPRSIANYLKSTSEQPDPSQRIAEDIQFAGSALAGIPPAIGDYFARKAEQPDPSQRIAEDIQNLGGGFAKMFAENPIGTILDFMNLPGAVTSLREASEAKKEYEEAVSHGDEKKASDAKNRYAMALPGIIPVIGVGMKASGKVAGVAEKFAGKAGTSAEEMAGLLDKVRGTELGKMVERYQGMPAEEAHKQLFSDLKSLATEGEVGKEWYERSSQRILDFVGGDKDAADKFAQLIAIYSPQTAVDVNTQNAMKAYNRALTGEKLWDGKIIDKNITFPTIKAANDYVRKLGGSEAGYTKIPLDDSGKRFLIAQHGDKNAYENIATLDRDLKAHLVMKEGVPFEGRKINNFYNNLMVQIDPSRLQGSTQDLWMARAFGFLDDAVGGGAKYDYMERLTADLANELGWQPHQVQAAIWTAMKTRQEGVKSAVRAEAVAKGLADIVPDPTDPTKKIFQVREGQEKAYGELMRERALGAEITPEAIAAAARDFADFLDQNIAFVTWEATPSTKVGHLQGFEKLSPEVRAEYQMGIQQALQDADGNDLLARYLNILSPGGIDAPGYWEGASNPQRLTQVGTTRIKGAGQAPSIDAASKELMEVYAAAMGLLLKQDGVGFHRPYYNPQISKANGIEYKFGKPLSSEDIVHIGKELEKKFGTDAVGLIPVGNDTVRIINFYWPSKEHGFGKVFEYRTDKGRVAYASSKRGIPKDAKTYPALDKDGNPNPLAGKKIIIEHENAKIGKNEKGNPTLDTFRDQRDFHTLVDEVISGDKIDNVAEGRFFGSDGDLISNTTPKQAELNQFPGWKGNPNGEGYIQRLRAAGRSDVLEYISDFLAPRVEEFDRQFADRYGLKRNEALEGQIRNAKQLSVDYARGGPVNFAKGGAVDTGSVTENVMSEIAESGLDRRQIATLLRMASTGTLAPDKAIEFADTILTGNMADMERRFQEYPRSMRILSRVDAAVGGKSALAYGNAANRNPEGPLAYDGGADRGYAKGGSVRRGSANIMKEVREYALTQFGAPTIKGMEARAGGDPAKFIFALNQYTKNLAAQDPQAYGEMYKQQIAAMNEIAKKYNINLRAAFRRDPGIPQTVDKLDEAMGAAKTPVFKEALERMHQILGG